MEALETRALMAVLDVQAVLAPGGDLPGITGESGVTPLFPYDLNNSGDVAFRAGYTNPPSTSLKGGVFAGTPGNLRLIANQGAAPPGTSGLVYGDIGLTNGKVVMIDNQGNVAFRAELAASATPTTRVVDGFFVGHDVATAQLLDLGAAGTSLAFARLPHPSQSNINGEVAFGFGSSGTGALEVQQGTVGNLRDVAVQGGTAPDLTAQTFNVFDTPRVNEDGHVAFAALMTGSTQTHLFAEDSAGSLHLVARVGAPLTAGGPNVSAIDPNYGFNTAEQVAFSVTFTGGSRGVFVWQNGALTEVARTGDPVQVDGLQAAFSSFGGTVINSAGQVAFVAVVQGAQITTATDDTVWVWSPGNLRLAAREGEQVLNSPSGTYLGNANNLVLNSLGQVAFTAFTSSNIDAIIAENSLGSLNIAAYEGAMIEVAPGDIRTIAGVTSLNEAPLDFIGWTGNDDGRPSGFNDVGQVAFKAAFGIGGSRGLFLTAVPAAPAEIHGFKFNDIDGDGVWDAGEPGLNGWTIELLQNDQVIASTVTGDDPATPAVEVGAYGFTGLAVGDYTVREVLQAGWEQTFPSQAGLQITKINHQLAAGTFVHGFQYSPDSTRMVYGADDAVPGKVEWFSGAVTGGDAVKISTPISSPGEVGPARITPDSQTVVYRVRNSPGMSNVYSVPITGGSSTQLNNPLVAGGEVGDFTLTPDGSRVVYVADQETNEILELYSVPTGGGAVTKLNPPLPAMGRVSVDGLRISPDSTRVVYLAYQDSLTARELYSVPVAGGASVKLNGSLVAGGNVELVQQITPDGSRAIYEADQDTDGKRELYSAPIAGGASVKLNDPFFSPGLQFVGVTPDSAWVVYYVDQAVAGINEIFKVSPSGGAPIKIGPTLPAGRNLGSVQLSPDGKYVIYRADQDTNDVFELYSVPISGGPSVKLSGTLVNGGAIDSPYTTITGDSKNVIYVADQDTDGIRELYSVPITGGTPVKLNAPFSATKGLPITGVSYRVSPDGKAVVYMADQDTDNVMELFYVPTVGGTAQKISQNLVAPQHVQSDFFWSPDSQTVGFRLTATTTELYAATGFRADADFISLTEGQIVRGDFGVSERPNFGNHLLAAPPAEIHGFKWNDQDGDGVWDAGEPGLNGWTIQLLQNGQVIASTVTGDDPTTTAVEVGAYSFTGLAAGDYTIREVLQDGWRQTFPTSAGDSDFIEWVTVGNPGNAGDVQNDGTFGAVDHTYRIGKYEVTNTQYAAFLNAVDAAGANPHSVYSSNMDSDARGGISLVPGNAPGSKYVVKAGRGNNPVIFVSYFDTMRFMNWLENGRPTDGSGTETGTYAISDGMSETRAVGASYFIPTENEWYKAAYHKNDGVTGNYWDYPTGTDATPYSDNPASLNTPDNSNTANYRTVSASGLGYNDGYAVTGSLSFDNATNYLTDVGAYTLAASPYGTFDQAGSLWEFNETLIFQGNHGVRGGSWGDEASNFIASYRFLYEPPNFQNVSFGFRVAGLVPNEVPGDHQITVTDGQVIDGSLGVAEAPNFGNQLIPVPPAEIHGYKWNDVDGNGAWDGGEQGLDGWTIELLQNGQVIASTVTGDDPTTTEIEVGAYAFTDLPAGNYTVREVLQTGWQQTYPGGARQHDVALATSDILSGTFGVAEAPNFGNLVIPPPAGAEIHGYKWNDLDGDGAWDTGEPGLNGWTIELVQDGQVIASTVTGDDPVTAEVEVGAYSFTDLAAGGYTVREVLQTGWQQTFPGDSGQYSVVLSASQILAGAIGAAETPNFGNQLIPIPPAQIHGFKWDDVDGDGAWDQGEPGLNGWTIELVQGGQVIASTVTGDDPTTPETEVGAYGFTGLAAGTYTVREVPQQGWQQTYPGDSGDHVVVVAASQIVSGAFGVAETPNFGNQLIPIPPAEIHGFKWNDLDGDSVWDQGEPGLNGWTIELVQDGQVIASTVTGDDPTTPETEVGAYAFTGLDAGTYTVREVLQTGWQQTYPGSGGQHQVVLATSQIVSGAFGTAAAPNFGNRLIPPVGDAVIRGYKWNDLDGDGVWDETEPALSGWTIQLVRDGQVVAETVTGDDPTTPAVETGVYRFSGLVAGTYTVREVFQAGWQQTFPSSSAGHQLTLANHQVISGRVGGSRVPNFGNQVNATVEQDPPATDVTLPAALTFVASTLTFDPAVNLPTANQTGRVTAGDLDGDLDIDLVTSSEVGNSISIFLNNGDGTFAPRIDRSVGNDPVGIVIADLDGDNDADIAVTIDNSIVNPGRVVVLKNNGSVVFANPVDVGAIGRDTQFMIAVDVDNDLDLDLVTADQFGGPGTVSVMRNNGNATFAAATVMPAAGQPYHVAAGDLNGDGFADIVSANRTSNTAVYINNGNGTFAAPVFVAAGTFSTSSVIKDLDGDGDNDLAIANRNSDNVSILINTGGGQLAAAQNFPVGNGPGIMTAGDFDGVNGIDLAFPGDNSSGADFVSVLLNNGAGSFAAPLSFATGPGSLQAVAAKLNSDSRLDLTVVNYVFGNPGTLSILLNSTAPASTAEIHGFKWNDLDGDSVWDNGEPGLNGWTIQLVQNDQVIAETITGDDPSTTDVEAGAFGFTGLAAGTYFVREVLQDGWQQTFPAQPPLFEVPVAAGEIVQAPFGTARFPSFGNQLIPVIPAEIHGFKWNDLDGDGAWDAGEPGLDGWTIELVQNGQVVASTVTGDDPSTTEVEVGAYGFTGLAAGDYTVREVLRSGWQQTFPGGSGEHQITLTTGQVIRGPFGVATASNYDYTLIVQEDDFVNQIFYTFNATPIISGDGTVYWRGSRSAGGVSTNGIFRFQGGTISTVLDTGGVFSSFSEVAVNDVNVLAIRGTLDTGVSGLFRWDGATLTTIVDNTSALTSFANISINHAGQVSFRARVGTEDGIYVGNGGTPAEVASETGIYSQIFANSTINNVGHVIFNSDLDAGGRGLFVWDGTGVTELYSTNGGYFQNISSQDFNALNEAVFLGTVGGKSGVYRGDGGNPELVAEQDGFFFTFFAAPGPSINNNGDVIFLTDKGIYKGPDHVRDLVIPTSGSLFGRPLGGGALGRGLNDAGQVAALIRFQRIGGPLEEALVLASPVPSPTPNFGNRLIPPPAGAEIHGYKWNDLDGDGAWDTGEPGLNGWTIELVQDGQVIASTVTGDDPVTAEVEVGAYSFTDLAAGSYTVREVLQSGWQQTFPGDSGEYSLVLSASQIVSGAFGTAETPNFGNQLIPIPPAEIHGYKWNDVDGDNVWDQGEPGLNGWTIELVQGGQVVASTVTGDDPTTPETEVGAYAFAGLDAGTYTVREVPQQGWQQTYPGDSGQHLVVLATSQIVSGAFGTAESPNFGNQLIPIPPAEIHGFKWDDVDGDGAWDQGEPGLNGWTIELVQGGQVVASTVTGDDPTTPETEVGAYAFTGLDAGTYTVREVLQTGWQQTYPGNGGQYQLVLATSQIVSGAFGTAAAPNFGNRLIPPVGDAVIRGYKWNDLDGDGVWDETEPALSGWTIQLVRDGQIVAETVTGDDPTTPKVEVGIYRFAGLTAGTYTVREVLQSGWLQTFPNSSAGHQLTLADHQVISGRVGGSRVPNFGNQVLPARIKQKDSNFVANSYDPQPSANPQINGGSSTSSGAPGNKSAAPEKDNGNANAQVKNGVANGFSNAVITSNEKSDKKDQALPTSTTLGKLMPATVDLLMAQLGKW